MSINEVQDKLIEDLMLLDDEESRKQYIDNIADSLPVMEDRYKHEHYQVQGWISDIWIRAVYIKERVWFTAAGSAKATNGLLAMFARVLSGNHPKDIADADIYFMNEIAGLFQPFFSVQWPLILRKMKSQAVAYQIQLLQSV
ncbi:SufE family protein [Chitinophaga rhizophila]|uniref:SufE family protein n=1 Tax=Chitinophaga rhizophila TaxID=2866212 RepID=A0ABS7GG47_9BACT|nr:SufE family protein [Chitinophaga rhizophila]MBW8686667.1 SufE family protein [Chitinophaga rhizophila]